MRRRSHRLALWGWERSDYTARYPELDFVRRLPPAAVLDGELVALRQGLRFAIQLLKAARQGGEAAALTLLGQLRQRPLWHEFYEWLFPLADRLCGRAFLFEQIEHQSTYPLPARCGHEVWHAANRLLGRAKSDPTPLPTVETPPRQTVANNTPIIELAEATLRFPFSRPARRSRKLRPARSLDR